MCGHALGLRQAAMWMCGACLSIVSVAQPGCASRQPSGPYAAPTERERDPVKAQELCERAASIMDTDPRQAEQLLREAITADLYHGPSHNNLGVIYLARGELYAAANEFEWARKLMPGHPDPRINLGLVFERAERPEDAIDAYRTALEVQSEYMPAVQALTRCELRRQHVDDATRERLQMIALRGTTEQWRRWAVGQVATHPTLRLGGDEDGRRR